MARLAAGHDRVVHVVHAQEGATAGDAGIDAPVPPATAHLPEPAHAG